MAGQRVRRVQLATQDGEATTGLEVADPAGSMGASSTRTPIRLCNVHGSSVRSVVEHIWKHAQQLDRAVAREASLVQAERARSPTRPRSADRHCQRRRSRSRASSGSQPPRGACMQAAEAGTLAESSADAGCWSSVGAFYKAYTQRVVTSLVSIRRSCTNYNCTYVRRRARSYRGGPLQGVIWSRELL